MSVTKRVISGSAASWAQIVVGIVTQIAVVPVYLNYWDVKTYVLDPDENCPASTICTNYTKEIILIMKQYINLVKKLTYLLLI